MSHIRYKKGYKYQLFEAYEIETSFRGQSDIASVGKYVTLSKDGHLKIKKGYAWDGPSGPAIDTKNFMRGSLVHDAIYQLMRERKLSKDVYRYQADKLLKQICKEDGMSSIRAWWVCRGVRRFAKSAASHSNRRSVIRAP